MAIAVATTVVLVTISGSARAQGAWVNDAHSLTLGLGYQYDPSSAVVLTPNREQTDRPTNNQVATLQGEWVPLENLAIEASLPFAAVKYEGDPVNAQHTPKGDWDDGTFHYTPQDARVGVRYQILDEPWLAVSPYVAGTIPMYDYKTIGFATGGRHLDQVHFGLSVGRSLAPLLPHLFIAGTFEFTVSQHDNTNALTSQINEDRYDIDAQIGWIFLDGDLVIEAAGNTRHSLDGINFLDFGKLSTDLTNDHDRILKETWWFAGGGATYAITRKFSIDAEVRVFIQGYNTRLQNSYGLNLNWRVF